MSYLTTVSPRIFGSFSPRFGNSRHFSDLFDSLLSHSIAPYGAAVQIEFDESETAITASLPLPGFKREDVTLELTNQSDLSIVASRGAKRVERAISLDGSTLDIDSISAKLEDGILTVTLPKHAAAKPRKIVIS